MLKPVGHIVLADGMILMMSLTQMDGWPLTAATVFNAWWPVL
jgi:hypothetical protein